MSINSSDYMCAVRFVKFFMIEQQDWKPNLDLYVKGRYLLETCLQEKIKHTLSISSFDVEYQDYFRNRKSNFENFKLFVDELINEWTQGDFSNEEVYNVSVKMGYFGQLGYCNGITGAPDYAVSCIIHVLHAFRKKNQCESDIVLNIVSRRKPECKKRSFSDMSTDSSLNYANIEALHTSSESSSISSNQSVINNASPSCNDLKRFKSAHGNESPESEWNLSAQEHVCSSSENSNGKSERLPSYMTAASSNDSNTEALLFSYFSGSKSSNEYENPNSSPSYNDLKGLNSDHENESPESVGNLSDEEPCFSP